MNIESIKHNNITIAKKYHILFWLGYFLFNVIRWGSYFDDYWYSVKSNLVEFPLHIMLVYINLYYFIPKFLLKRKYKRYIVFLLLSLFFLYIIRTGLNYFLITENIWPEAEGYQKAFTFNHFIAVTLGELYVVALATAIKLTIDWIGQRNRFERLQKEHLKTELKFLKAQIQPHFFFNTLNNLYALTLDKSDKAPNVVLKLSDIMQYVLYEVKESRVNLLNEINYIQNYLDLEKLRYGDGTSLTTNIDGDINNVKVPPLLFLPFIENCFKHGSRDKNDFYVKIDFKNKENKVLQFTVENNFDEKMNFHGKNGIGNENVKRRLDLLFKENYSLNISESKHIYKVLLEIPLNEPKNQTKSEN